MAAPRHAAEGSDRRRLIVGIAVTLLVALAAAWLVLLRTTGDDTVGLTPTVAATPSPEAEEQDDGGKIRREVRRARVETFEVFAARDPFRPLVDDGGGGTGGGATLGGPAGAPAGGGSVSNRAPVDDEIGGRRIRLVDIFKRGGAEKAQVQIDGTVYTVDEGERFAENFQLLSISGSCATMLFGDDQFTLCEGEEILK